MRKASFVAVVLLAACGGGGGGGTSGPLPATPTPASTATPTPVPTTTPPLAQLQRISADPFTNSGSQHATEVEPSLASNGATIVASFQTGRFFSLGSSDIGFATSFDGGTSWQAGVIPATTHYALPSGPYDSISDPSVAYDAAHATWLITALPIVFNNGGVPGVVVSRSPDGVTWSNPIAVTPPNETANDKNWIVCDNHASSPYYGHCYLEWDLFAGSGSIMMSVSTDGGRTWSAPGHPTPDTNGIGGQPVVQPDGTVIVPIDDGGALSVLAFTSHDGGATWSRAITVSNIADHLVAGNLRSLPLISAAIDAAGKTYVVWHDCRFRVSCASNDLVMTTSTDGVAWSPPARIPIDETSSVADHFIPGLSVEPGTSGAGAHLGITYYSYANASCTASTCQLFANYIASQDGGATWGAPHTLAGPMSLGWIAQTQDGAMVGDYMASTFSPGRPLAIVAVANPLRSGAFDEGMYVTTSGTILLQSSLRRSSLGQRPVPGFHSDHGPRRIHP